MQRLITNYGDTKLCIASDAANNHRVYAAFARPKHWNEFAYYGVTAKARSVNDLFDALIMASLAELTRRTK